MKKAAPIAANGNSAPSRPTVTALICAAGKGSRARFDKNKLLTDLDGAPALMKTLSAFDLTEIDEILIAVSADDYDTIKALCAGYQKARLVLGGETRTQTVRNALREVKTEIVLIHDGARPFIQKQQILGCIDSVKRYGSGVCCAPVVDTIAQTDGERISSVPNRALLRAVQTPQGFYTKEILRAYEQAAASGNAYTDDSSIYLQFIGKPRLCEGSPENKKLTYAEDFSIAKSENPAPEYVLPAPIVCAPADRVGFGVDTHAFGKEQNFITLCGVTVPSDSGLIAHSDGDVALHALMDSLLSAAGLKDIGHYFPDTDERFRGANSMALLAEVVRLIAKRGFAPRNVSIAIQAEKPRLAGYIDKMKKSVAAALSIDETAVGITAGTNERLGYVGEGKGITVYATSLLLKK